VIPSGDLQSVAYRGGVWGVQIPPPEIQKALQNRTKAQPDLLKLLKIAELGRQRPKMFGKKAVKF